MKYMNFLAGALGLMALAACNSVIEQPNALSTITVAYNQGPATRTTITPNPEQSYPYQYATNGIKVTWEPGDRIALIKDGTTYTYETDEEGEVATFTLVNGPAPTAEGDYKMVYPADWTGDLTDFAKQNLYGFNPRDYLYATGTATLTDGAFEQTVALTPIFSFLFIIEDTPFSNLDLWDLDVDYMDENGQINIPVELEGTNLFNEIVNFDGTDAPNPISLSNLAINCNASPWAAASDYMIAIPVVEGKPVTELKLSFDGVKCRVFNKEGSDWLTIERGGLIYFISDEGNNLYVVTN